MATTRISDLKLVNIQRIEARGLPTRWWGWDKEARDYAFGLDDELLGYAINAEQAQARLNELIQDHIRHAIPESADALCADCKALTEDEYQIFGLCPSCWGKGKPAAVLQQTSETERLEERREVVISCVDAIQAIGVSVALPLLADLDASLLLDVASEFGRRQAA